MSKLELTDITGEMITIVCPKKWYKSRTMWLNLATVVAGGAPLVANFTGLISPLVYAMLMTAVGLANIALRLLTDTGIE